MARAGRRYSLVMYTRMIDRWWPATLLLAVGLFALAWEVQSYFPDPNYDWRWLTLGSVGGSVLVVTLFLLVIRKAAYVQPRADHLRLVTPFLRLNISYKRLQRASSATVSGLFPVAGISNWQREILEPLAKKTAIVVELNGYPISQAVLRLFLSPFFSKIKLRTSFCWWMIGCISALNLKVCARAGMWGNLANLWIIPSFRVFPVNEHLLRLLDHRGRELESVYEAFVSALSTDGHEVPTAHLVLPGVTEETRLEPRMVYERDTAWIYNCDVLIAEVSVPSHGVGYEIGYALSAAKPALCLVQEGRKLSKMIGGIIIRF